MKAIIPARKGSDRLPHKNRRYVGDKHLVEHAVHSARACFDDEDIVVATDDEMIKAWTRQQEVELFETEERFEGTSAIYPMREYAVANDMKYACFCLLQPTSPLRHKDDILSWYREYVNLSPHDTPFYYSTTHDGGGPCGCFYIFRRLPRESEDWVDKGEPLETSPLHPCVDIDDMVDLREARAWHLPSDFDSFMQASS